MKAQIKAWLSFFAFTSAEAGFFVAWKGLSIEAAGNVLLFWIWFISILGVCMLFVSKSPQPRSQSTLRTALEAISSVLMAISLAWYGLFVTAAFYVLGQIGIWSFAHTSPRIAGGASGEGE